MHFQWEIGSYRLAEKFAVLQPRFKLTASRLPFLMSEEVMEPSGSPLTHKQLLSLSFILLYMKLCHRYIFFCIQVLAGALALGFDSAIATSLNMLPRASIEIVEAMRNNYPKEALQEQRKLSQAINAITRNGMCLSD